MDPVNGIGVPDLGRAKGMVLGRAYLISMSAVDILDGGLHDPKCDRHLRVIDLAQGIGWYVPLNANQLQALTEQSQ